LEVYGHLCCQSSHIVTARTLVDAAMVEAGWAAGAVAVWGWVVAARAGAGWAAVVVMVGWGADTVRVGSEASRVRVGWAEVAVVREGWTALERARRGSEEAAVWVKLGSKAAPVLGEMGWETARLLVNLAVACPQTSLVVAGGETGRDPLQHPPVLPGRLSQALPAARPAAAAPPSPHCH
jgi:hypothetical protein